MSDKLERFRLVAEMDNGNVFAVSLTDKQQENLHKILEVILDGHLNIHALPFGVISDMTPAIDSQENSNE